MKNTIKNLFLLETSSIKSAIKKLNKYKCQIILVLNKNHKLSGTVTDGDIRRSIIKNNNLNKPLKEIMNKNPIVIKEKKSIEEIRKLMRINSVLQVPEVDKKNFVKKIHYWNPIFKVKNKKNIFFIMAGGKGKRLLPLTKFIPKPMLKIGNKPILENLIRDAKNFGFLNFVLSVNYKKAKIKNYFKDGKKFNIKIKYVSEKKPLGTAGSLSLLKSKTKGPIIVANGDIHTQIDFLELLNFHNKNKAFATTVIKQIEQTSEFGIIKNKGIYFENFEEKPIKKFNINTGIYVFNRNIVKHIKHLKIDMPEILIKLKKKKKKIIIFPAHEHWSDLGLKKNLLKINKKLI